MALTFRPTTADDLPLLHRWLNEPGVVRWWEGDDVSWAGVVRDYGPDRDPGCAHHLCLDEGEPVGWIQACDDWSGDDEGAHWLAAGVPGTAAGIDYLVGDPARRGVGLGSAMIAAYCDRVVFAAGSAFTHAVASPQVANEASWRALRAAGFTHLADFDDTLGPCRILLLARGGASTPADARPSGPSTSHYG